MHALLTCITGEESPYLLNLVRHYERSQFWFRSASFSFSSTINLIIYTSYHLYSFGLKLFRYTPRSCYTAQRTPN
jgi:hypothetical protein